MNGDGEKDLVTGKRWWAHGPHGDDFPNVAPVIVWFEIHKKKGEAPQFIPHLISESLGTGIGTQFLVTDFDGDKIPDIVLSNKKGTNVLLQRRGRRCRVSCGGPHSQPTGGRKCSQRQQTL